MDLEKTQTIPRIELERAYKSVERDELATARAVEQPRAVVLGGQPGSGKSGLAYEATKELSKEGGSVLIDADRMRENNPQYKALLKTDPQNAADKTQAEAGAWSNRLTVAAMESKRNLVIDGTMRSPENIKALAEGLRDNGYKVDVRVMAVPEDVSMARARLRFEEQAAENGHGRFVNKAQHDAAYQGMPATVKMLEREKLADTVMVYSESRQVIYKNEQERGEWKQPAQADRAIEQERGRELTYQQKRDQSETLGDVAALVAARERATGQAVPDKAEVIGRLQEARNAVLQVEKSDGFQRTQAFADLPKKEALAKYPELDGSYKQLQEVKAGWTEKTSQHERETSYFEKKASLSGQLESGAIPKGNVTREESAQVIALAAASRGLMLRDGANSPGHDTKGEVVATSSHHTLVKISESVALKYESATLDREVQKGQQITIRPAAEKNQVYDRGQEPPREQSRDMGGREMTRDNR